MSVAGEAEADRWIVGSLGRNQELRDELLYVDFRFLR